MTDSELKKSRKKPEKKPWGKKAKREKRLAEIAARRKDVEHSLNILRVGAHREFAFLPKGEKWLLPSVAFALGIALAGGGSKSGASSAPAYEPAPEPKPENVEPEESDAAEPPEPEKA